MSAPVLNSGSLLRRAAPERSVSVVGSPLGNAHPVTESPDGPVEYAESYERSDILATWVTVSPDPTRPDSVLSYET